MFKKITLPKLNQSGVAHLLYPILGLAVVAVIAGASFYVYQQNNSGAGAKRYKYKFKIEVYKPTGEGIANCQKAAAEARLKHQEGSCRSNKVAKSKAEISIYSDTIGDTCGNYLPERDLSKFGPTQIHRVYRGTKASVTCTSTVKPHDTQKGAIGYGHFVVRAGSDVSIEYACNAKGAPSTKGKNTCFAVYADGAYKGRKVILSAADDSR